MSTLAPREVTADTRLEFAEITDPVDAETQARIVVTAGDTNDLLDTKLLLEFGIERWDGAWVQHTRGEYQGGPNVREPEEKFDPPALAFTMSSASGRANNYVKGSSFRAYIKPNITLNVGGTFSVLARS